jgi:hypothetical protein
MDAQDTQLSEISRYACTPSKLSSVSLDECKSRDLSGVCDVVVFAEVEQFLSPPAPPSLSCSLPPVSSFPLFSRCSPRKLVCKLDQSLLSCIPMISHHALAFMNPCCHKSSMSRQCHCSFFSSTCGPMDPQDAHINASPHCQLHKQYTDWRRCIPRCYRHAFQRTWVCSTRCKTCRWQCGTPPTFASTTAPHAFPPCRLSPGADASWLQCRIHPGRVSIHPGRVSGSCWTDSSGCLRCVAVEMMARAVDTSGRRTLQSLHVV